MASSQASREARNERRRAARAAARSSLNAPVETESAITPEAIAEVVNAAPLTEAEILTGLIKAAGKSKKGKTFSTPIGQIEAVVVVTYRDSGAILLTEDGGRVPHLQERCNHELAADYVGPYFEVVGPNPIYGFVHRARGCNKPYRVAAAN